MRVLFRNVLLPIVALIALGLVIWFIGPLFVFAGWAPLEPEVARIVLFVVLVSIWALNKVRKHFKAKSENEALAEQVVQVDESEAQSREEVALLKERLQSALGVMKEAKLGGSGESRQLYELPWYIIIGPPGAGKTTALVNSGLRFPLAERFGQDSLQGVGGTRHCDWWFTDEAVMIDTAGRYTTQDSNRDVDSAAWTGFLSLLKKYRKRRPINGALVAISVSELLGQSEAEMASHATTIRQRIQELQSQLGVRFPVYVLLTKCDLLAGFSEFFDDLRRDQREQVWGMTFERSDARDHDPIGEEFVTQWQALEARLHEHLLERLEYERAPQRRDLIYAFPQQISALGGLLNQFLSDVFRPSRYEETPMVRGVYLTSATQAGNPIDRVLGSVASSFGIRSEIQPAFSGRGRSFFLTRLMREVVFAESGLAGTNLREERRRAWLQRAAYAGCIAILGLGALAWIVSYGSNKGFIDEVDQATVVADEELTLLVGQSQSYFTILPSLNEVRALPRGYLERDADVPMRMRFGLYQGRKLGGEAEQTYVRLLHNLMLPKMVYELEDALRRDVDDREWLYETLKAYLMLDNPDRYEWEHVAEWFLLDWEFNPLPNIGPVEEEELIGHLEAITQNLQTDSLPIALDEKLIEDTRAVLRRMPMAERILGRLKLEIRGSDKASDFRVDQAAGNGAEIVFTRRSGKPLSDGVNALFTYDGYKDFFRPETLRIATGLLKEQWVLGESETLADAAATARRIGAVVDEVEELYFTEYIDAWDQLLADIEIAGFGSAAEAAIILNEAARPASPIVKLLDAVAEETTLYRPSQNEANVREGVSRRIGQSISSRLSRATGGARIEGPDLSRDEAEAQTPVDEHFEELHRLVEGESSRQIDRITQLIDDVYLYVDALSVGDVAQGGATSVRRLRAEARRQPSPVRGWMEALAYQSNQTGRAGASSQLTQKWVASVLPACRQLVIDRFPFDPSARRQVSLREFGRVFGHNGLVDQFFQQNLAQYIDRGRSPWRWRTSGPGAPSLSPQSAAAFEKAARIRDAYFQDGGQTPSARFDIAPSYLDDRVDSITLNLEGQRIVYRHGPIRYTSVKWPGDSDYSQVQVQISPAPPSGRSTLLMDGPWAWLKLVQQATVEDDPNVSDAVLRFDIGGREARFRIRTDLPVDPFSTKLLETISCPASL